MSLATLCLTLVHVFGTGGQTQGVTLYAILRRERCCASVAPCSPVIARDVGPEGAWDIA